MAIRRRPPQWRLERINKGRSRLVRLVAPLEDQRNRQKTMCVAIGSEKRLEKIIDILNDLGVEV